MALQEKITNIRKIKTPKIGDRFGSWVFKKEVPFNFYRTWLCKCLDCNRTYKRSMYSILKSTRCSSCRSRQPRLNGRGPFWIIKDNKVRLSWNCRFRTLLHRCDSKKSTSYKNYGARGITVEPYLRNPQNFVKFIMTLRGWDNLSLSLDRINNDGNYARGNLRMATRKEQANNRQSSSKMEK